MKIYDIIKKNFKILLRSKASAFVVTVGPLLIIGLIALAFSNSQEFDITLGIISLEETDLGNDFISQLKEDDYTVINYEDLERCQRNIKSGTVNVCILLPEDFEVKEGQENVVRFYVDQSRVNIVQSIISSVGASLSVKSEEITLSLTDSLLDTIGVTATEVESNQKNVDTLKSGINSAESHVEVIQEKGKSSLANTEDTFTNLDDKASEVNASAFLVNEETDSLLLELNGLLNSLEEDGVYSDKTAKVRGHYDDLKEILEDEGGNVTGGIADLRLMIASLREQISATGENLRTIENSAGEVADNLNIVRANVDQLDGSLGLLRDKINNLQVKSAENIVNPITVEINPILATSNKSIFMFPYLLVMVILFVSMMLSSTLVVMEKRSRAFFRTFTTPTREIYHIVGGYITNLIVLVVQLSIVLVAAYFYLGITLLDNYPLTLLVLFLSTTFFILLGSMLGYVFKTQEGTTIASISIGSLLLFLSNVILPVESFPYLVRRILLINPYMLCSELLKKSILFNSEFSSVLNELALLLIYIVIVAIFVFVFQKISVTRMLNGFSSRKILRRHHITKENYFKLKEGTILKSKSDLVKALKNMDDAQFSLYVSKKGNEFAVWIKDAFKDKKLVKKIKKANSREETLKILEEETN